MTYYERLKNSYDRNVYYSTEEKEERFRNRLEAEERRRLNEEYMDEKGKFCLEKANPIVYSHGTYFSLGKELGTFGYSVKK